jgi:hypothetical protein
MSVVFHNFKSSKAKILSGKVYYKQACQNSTKKTEESYLQKLKNKNIKVQFQ